LVWRWGDASSRAARADEFLVEPLELVLDSQIVSDFEGWDGDTLFEFANGQIWQQSAYAYQYHYAFRPHAIIYKHQGSFEMQVDGIDSTLQVQRIQ